MEERQPREPSRPDSRAGRTSTRETYTEPMSMLTNDLYNKIMLFNSHPTAEIMRECIVEAGECRFIHRGRADWLIGDTEF